MTIYQVRLINSAHNLDQIIEVPDNEYILDMAEEAGIHLPSGCLHGECSVCLAKIIEGHINQEEQNFLSQKEIEAGYTVTCVSYPLSDCTLETHQEEVLYQNSLYFT